MPISANLAGKLTLPVIGSPMFIVSGPELVLAQCQAGIVGTFPALNARPVEELEVWLTRIKTDLAAYQAAHPAAKVAPFGVNLIVHPSNERLEQDLEMVVRHEVPVIITSLKAPERAVLDSVHRYGGVVFHDVINVRHARKAAEAGVDGLILVCAGGGGHAGRMSPFALIPEVREFFGGVIILAGAISDGCGVLSALAMGADLAYLGTRFIATQEANAVPEYKRMIVESSAEEVVYTDLFSNIHANYLSRSVRNAGLDPNNLPPSEKGKSGFKSAGGERHKVWKDIWGAGQGVGAIQDIPTTAELVARMRQEFAACRSKLAGLDYAPDQ